MPRGTERDSRGSAGTVTRPKKDEKSYNAVSSPTDPMAAAKESKRKRTWTWQQGGH